jgi:hypothetical protein
MDMDATLLAMREAEDLPTLTAIYKAAVACAAPSEKAILTDAASTRKAQLTKEHA